MNTFSLISNKFPEDDESFFIDIVLNSKVTNSHFLIVDPISPLKDVDNLMWHLEQPIPSPNMNLFWDLFKKMKKNNIRVAISGYDGDTVCYMGQFYLKELAFNLKLKKLIKEINSISKNKNEDYLNIIYSNIILPSIPLTIKKLWNKKQNKTLKDSILENDLIGSKFDFKKRYEELNLSSIQPKSSKKFHYKWLTLGTHQNAFEQLNKHFSAFSIEPRFPFFDKRVVEFCYGIPAEQKFQSGWNRLILRRSMENILPKSIQWRPRKRFFGSVFKNNFIRGEEKKLEEIIYELSDKYDIFVKKEDFERIYQRSKKKSNYSDIWDLWQLVTFVIWLEKNNIKIKNL
jgi:asparagine synthase (glutamine-hydrolysing)